MNRREFVAGMAGAAAWHGTASTQQSGRVRVVGILMLNEENDPEGQARLAGFRQNLASLGWEEGRTARVEVRWYGGDLNRAKSFAKEIIDRSPDVIVANGTLGVTAVQQLTKLIPIIFVVVTDPV